MDLAVPRFFVQDAAMPAGETPNGPKPMLRVGRYVVFQDIARGGYATIHLARSVIGERSDRVVAVKRLHRDLLDNPDVCALFVDEARIVARVHHPNIVQNLDVVESNGETFIVFEFVDGVTLNKLMRHAWEQRTRLPVGLAVRVMIDVLRGLDAAHRALDDAGEALRLIHRDVTSENMLVGVDGVSRLLDFGIARAVGQTHHTSRGQLRGKVRYVSPEQIHGQPQTQQTDLFIASVVLWEALTGKRLFSGRSVAEVIVAVTTQTIDPPSTHAPLPTELDDIVLRGLMREPERRWPNAAEMADALEASNVQTSADRVASWVKEAAADTLREHQLLIDAIRRAPLGDDVRAQGV
jgi:serine/threonine-protein kinase